MRLRNREETTIMMNYNNGYNNYGAYNPNTWGMTTPNYQQLQQTQNQSLQQNQVPSFSTIFVSNIAEAIATKPDVTGKPLFFYNKADEEIYIKQYDNTGAAPVKTYKLIINEKNGENKEQANSTIIVDSIKELDNKLNEIKNLLIPIPVQSQSQSQPQSQSQIQSQFIDRDRDRDRENTERERIRNKDYAQ